MALAWWRVFSGVYSGVSIFSSEAWNRAWNFIQKLSGTGEESAAGGAAYTKASEWKTIFGETLETLGLSLSGAFIAGVGALLFSSLFSALPSSRPSSSPLYSIAPSAAGRFSIRALFTLTRTIPDLIWALLLLLILGPGNLGVALALAIHNFGVLGRLFNGVLSANPAPPGGRISGVGASKIQQFYYADLAVLSPQFLTLWLNRWEIIIRSTVVLGFVSSTGLGLHLRLALSSRQFTEVALVLAAYFILTILVDLASAAARRLIRSS